MAALRLGWKYPTYAAHESGLRVYPAKVAAKYARAFNVSPEFLIYGTRPPEWWDHKDTGLVEHVVPVRYLTLVSDQSADDVERLTGPEAPVRKDYCVADIGDLPAFCFAYKVATDEMLDAAPQGSVLVIDRDPDTVKPGSLVLLSVKRQIAPSLRRVKSMPGGRVRYVAQNEDYEALDDTDARVIGRAVLVVRSL
ncbi:MAG: hypothetical protein B7Y80_09500 [Hyphomicrobium sp. 32-62-53]|nr:MAG: hypothetical protein B7Z29_09220 [Hyphomicrobium sp. 12-62-95]OYX99813.1 MAG: hypothetical protein B7Y80_09500 [Hyphomicrobium sp. 32-62-53]